MHKINFCLIIFYLILLKKETQKITLFIRRKTTIQILKDTCTQNTFIDTTLFKSKIQINLDDTRVSQIAKLNEFRFKILFVKKLSKKNTTVSKHKNGHTDSFISFYFIFLIQSKMQLMCTVY